ncbi:ParB N-terminal domain-containing protein [Fertoebacter nigrum]|uniref:ParB N-terminal domain-containing protein n=1 Tax=Fertoeibacter niger TaxID=2656921 RepID=A0A8X8H3F1_9RHOB|nr:ParB N-terminal domain-containing protein [Fertoeibacter niger]NUB46510.1 ParB N-terminal domain-containing protein [Fertoeibacter niger]
MAKRRRLTPARDDYLLPDGPEPAGPAGPEARPALLPAVGLQPAVRAPISQIAGDAAASAALDAVSQELRQARQEGRMVLAVPLDQIDAAYLVRDRLAADQQDLDALMQSLRQRGQQSPIEIVAIDGGRYGLISGWRRLTALRRLLAETGEPRFGVVQCLLRHPETAADAYVAMVEENEIRVGLSYYERARIAARAVELGVYGDEKAALLALFSTASRAKRSKIRSFLPIYHGLDARLRFATAIPERLGLRLAKRIEEQAGFAATLAARLAQAPAASADEELLVLTRALGRPASDDLAAPEDMPSPEETALSGPSDPVAMLSAGGGAGGPQGVRMAHAGGQITLSGPGVTDAFAAALAGWIATQI